MNAPVAVIIPAYNHEAFVERTLQSLAGQVRLPQEVILIDDCSRDRTWECANQVSRFLPFPVTLRRHERNRGICATLNEGLSMVQAPYVAVQASDDEAPPGKFALQSRFLEEHPEFGAVLGDIEIMDLEGRRIRVDRPVNQTINVTPEEGHGEYDLVRLALGRSSPAIQTGIFRTASLRRIGGFDESLNYEDLDVLLRLLAVERVAYLFQVGARYRMVRTGLHARFDRIESDYPRILGKQRESLAARGIPWSRVEAATWLRKANNRLNTNAQVSGLFCALRAVQSDPAWSPAWWTLFRSTIPSQIRGALKAALRDLKPHV